MRIKLHDAVGESGLFELLFDFGEVPMLGHAVRFHTFVPFAVDEIFCDLPTRAADTTVAINDDAFGVDESGFEEWDERNLHTRRIATWAGDE